MPLHRIPSGPHENDIDVLERAVKQIEAKGEQVVQVLSWGGYPVSEIVLLVEKARKTETRRQP